MYIFAGMRRVDTSSHNGVTTAGGIISDEGLHQREVLYAGYQKLMAPGNRDRKDVDHGMSEG